MLVYACALGGNGRQLSGTGANFDVNLSASNRSISSQNHLKEPFRILEKLFSGCHISPLDAVDPGIEAVEAVQSSPKAANIVNLCSVANIISKNSFCWIFRERGKSEYAIRNCPKPSGPLHRN